MGEKYGVDGAWPVFRTELADRPAALVVGDSRGKPFAPDRLPTLRRFLASQYERSAVVDGAVLCVRAD
ncbi:hypothetical protein [Streptomyces sp. WM6378]|uniref:hypothetical protein n=1 Tax=Streptomyces sp. WM6378 TaxID=1415557 RepID=UPI0006ADD2E6|nr:hypothetical protein [Streptomyces sp. WM6378]KOU36691.1 hypothetical protein ADK54_32920 [Streptomyces sp. WM6378]